ncbi:hypothetical protein VPH35_117188 [Triticum aestivum]
MPMKLEGSSCEERREVEGPKSKAEDLIEGNKIPRMPLFPRGPGTSLHLISSPPPSPPPAAATARPSWRRATQPTSFLQHHHRLQLPRHQHLPLHHQPRHQLHRATASPVGHQPSHLSRPAAHLLLHPHAAASSPSRLLLPSASG